jgi:histone H3/H4
MICVEFFAYLSVQKSIIVWNFLAHTPLSYKPSMSNLMKSSELGLSAMYRILKKAGADRVSDESADELRRVLEEIASMIAKSAVEMSNHAGRKTIRGEDVKLASKSFIK